MGTDRETLPHRLTTLAAPLRREARGHSNHLMAGSFSLICEDAEECTPPRIVNALRKSVILRHSCYVQVFDTDATILLRVLFGRLEVKVAPLAPDLQVLARNQAYGFLATMTTFRPPT
jgi:hypothetical protein